MYQGFQFLVCCMKMEMCLQRAAIQKSRLDYLVNLGHCAVASLSQRCCDLIQNIALNTLEQFLKNLVFAEISSFLLLPLAGLVV